MLIEISHAEFGYGGRAVVSVERLELRAGSAVGIFGPNGAGKTTLVRGLTGLMPAMKGNVKRRDRLQIVFLSQRASMESHWPMSGFDAAALGISARRRMGWLGTARSIVIDSMRAMQVEELADQPFFSLSGGQQQRILLAGAMAVRPEVLVLDEPTAGLDVQSRKMLLDALRRITSQGLCAVMVSHEIEDLAETCDQVAWLHPGAGLTEPSRVEWVSPQILAQRLTTYRRSR